MTDAKETEQERIKTNDAQAKEVENKFARIVDATSTLLKDTFPLGYKFFREVKKSKSKNT